MGARRLPQGSKATWMVVGVLCSMTCCYSKRPTVRALDCSGERATTARRQQGGVGEDDTVWCEDVRRGVREELGTSVTGDASVVLHFMRSFVVPYYEY